MIPKGLFTQIAMIALSIGIAFFYIEPTFSNISKMQDDINLYRTERQKVNSVNEQLASLVNRLDSVPAIDQRKLLVYMPDQVDTIAVPRILQNIARETGILFRQVDYGEVLDENIEAYESTAPIDYPVPHAFYLTLQGTYPQIKQTIALLEQNEFPLEVHELSISVLEGGFLNVTMMVVTYSHDYPDISSFNN